MITKLTEITTAVAHVLHIVKPVVLELVLFAWAMVELARFAMSVVFGHAG